MMTMEQPVISICIPAYKRIEILKRTIDSIYDDAISNNIDFALFEIAISDNDPEHEVESLISSYSHSNLSYHYTDCKGFMNSFFALKNGRGIYLKLLNSQSCFASGTLSELIELVQNNYDTKAIILMTNGMLCKKKVIEYNMFNQFMKASSFYSSWSNSFGIWRDDFVNLPVIDLNELFPHTSILFCFDTNRKYIIDDRVLFNIQTIQKKGGHNMFKSFSVDYMFLITDLYSRKRISTITYKSIRHDLVFKFFPHLFFKNQILKIDSYEYADFKINLRKYFPSYIYYLIILLGIFYPLFNIKWTVKNVLHS